MDHHPTYSLLEIRTQPVRRFPWTFVCFMVIFCAIGFMGWQMCKFKESLKNAKRCDWEKELAEAEQRLYRVMDDKIAILNLTIESRLKSLDELWQAKLENAKTLILLTIDQKYQTKVNANQSLSVLETRLRQTVEDKILQMDHKMTDSLTNLSNVFQTKLTNTEASVLSKIASQYLTKTEGDQKLSTLENKLRAELLSKQSFEQSIGVFEDHERPEVYNQLLRHRLCRGMAAFHGVGFSWDFVWPTWALFHCDDYYEWVAPDQPLKPKGPW